VSTKILAEMSVMIALSAGLHLVRVFSLPQGGSVTAGSMIPVMIFALRRGPRVGIIAGAILGLIVLVEEPFVYHPVQVLLDYPVAFAALGLAGLFSSNPLLGVGIGIGGRFLSHFASGIIFFATYAPEGMHPALYSLLYNGSFLSVEFIVTAIVTYGVFRTGILKIYR